MVLLADLLATESLELRLLGGDPRVPVRWVATSELDDPTAFLEGGELLLTTGLRTPRTGWARWVERLVAAGVCGVGFGVGLSHASVPRTLVRAAADTGLALVEVPVPTPFIAVSRRLADLVRRSENEAEAAAARAQRDLAAAAAGPDGTGAVLRRTARVADGTAWLLDGRGGVVAASHASPPPAAALEGLGRIRSQGARAAWSDVTADGTLTLRATGGGGERWLLVASAPDVPRTVRSTLGTAAALLGLLADRPATGALTGALTGAVVELVVGGHLGLARRLAASGSVDLPDPVLVARFTGPAPHGVLSGDGWALAADDTPWRGWSAGRAGIGRPVPLTDAADGARSAELAFARTGPHRPVAHAGERSLPELVDPPTLAAWARLRLEPLGAAADGDELRTTARVFLEHHGARQPAAEALGVHRNTLRQRLRRLEALLAISLDSPGDRAELWLALTAAGADRGTSGGLGAAG